MSRRPLLLIGLSLSIATVLMFLPNVVGAFLPDDKNRDRIVGATQSITHENITRLAILSIDKELFGVTEANLTSEMRTAMKEIAESNADVDTPREFGGDQFNNPASHFTSEEFPGAMTRIASYKALLAANLNINDVRMARWYLGQALHTLQDFYAHSNWIERGETSPWTALGDPSQVIRNYPPVSLRTCTNCTRDDCDDCVAPGSRLPLTTNTLTTAYYQGDVGRPKLSQFKCSHGGKVTIRGTAGLLVRRDDSGFGDLSNGINKDAAFCEISPHDTFHIDAAQVAWAATVKYLKDIRDMVGLTKMRKLLGFGRTMAFAVDTTGSMGVELAGIKQKINQIVDANRGTPLEPSIYVLSPFNDPDVGPLTVTDNADTFKNALNNLTAFEGGDCPELPFEGMYKALINSDESGDLVMFTDAGSRFGDHLFYRDAVLREAKAKKIRVHVVFSGVLSGACAPSESYARVAQATGGSYYEISPDEVDDAATLADLIFRPNLGVIFRVTGPLPGIAQTFPFRIDSLLTRPSFVISGTGATNIIVRRPDGSTVLPTDFGVTYIPLSTGAFYSFTNVVIGTWTITINPAGSGALMPQEGKAVTSSPPGTKGDNAAGSITQNENSPTRVEDFLIFPGESVQDSVVSTGEFSINVFADTNVQLSSFKFLEVTGTDAPHGGVAPTPGEPIAGQTSLVSAELSWNDNIAPSFQFRSLDGTILQTFTLTEMETVTVGEPPDSNHSRQFIGEVTVPSVPFQVYLTGTESSGAPYQRVNSPLFSPQPLKITTKSFATLSAGVTRTFAFNIQNKGPAGTFNVTASDEQGYVEAPGIGAITLATNETKEFTVSLNVPATALAGSLETIYIVAQRNDGSGVRGDAAFGPFAVQAAPVIKLGTVTTTPTSGSNSFVDPGEGAALAVQLLNTGSSTATDVQGILTAETAGVVTSVSEAFYPNIPAGGSGVNSTPFVFYVPTNFGCGQPIRFTLTVAATAGANTTVTEHIITVQPGQPSFGAAVTKSYTGPPVAIPDVEPVGVDVPIQVSGISGFISDLNFRIDGSSCNSDIGSTTVGLNHTFVSDLIVKLKSPSGRVVTLINRVGGFGINFCNTTLDDEATNSIQNVVSTDAPFSGSFKPAGSLADFKAENPNGTWTLTVSDMEAIDVGHVRAFSLIISPAQFSCTSSAADTTPPALAEGSYNPGPPASGQITVQDGGSGLALINVVAADNVNVQLPSFSAGTTASQVVTGTLINPAINGSFEVEAIDVAGNISSLNRTVLSAPAPKKILFRTNRHGSINYELYVMNEDGSNQTRLTNTPVTTGNYQPAWSPTGQKIGFAAELGGFWDIMIMNPDGSSVLNLTQHNAFESYFAFSPDGSKIVFESHRDGPFALWKINTDGTGLTKLVNNGGPEQPPSWSPNGQKIAFLSYINSVNNKTDVWVMNQDGTGLINLTQSADQESHPRWSPDGTKIAFARRPTSSSPYDIWVMNADGSNLLRLTTNSTSAAFDWSPDSTKIAFQSNRDGNLEIYVMNANGSNQTRLTNSSGSDFQPKWTADGTRILFTSFRTGNSEVFIMNANGTGQVNLTNNAAIDDSPGWQP